jgi:hypothetical protein
MSMAPDLSLKEIALLKETPVDIHVIPKDQPVIELHESAAQRRESLKKGEWGEAGQDGRVGSDLSLKELELLNNRSSDSHSSDSSEVDVEQHVRVKIW